MRMTLVRERRIRRKRFMDYLRSLAVSVGSEMLMQCLLLIKKRRTLRGLTLSDALRAVLAGLYTGHYARFSKALLQMYVLPTRLDPQRISLPGLP